MANETKHTQGPWKFIVEDGSRKIVAPTTEPRMRTRETLMCDTTYYPWCPDSDADWHLIAAAPEMFDALRHLLVGCDFRSIGGDEPQWHQISMPNRAALDKARFAIAKATGA